MSTSRILESKSAQLERSLHSKRITLSAARAELRHTEQSLTSRKGEFNDEIRRAVLRMSRKEEIDRSSSTSSNQAGNLKGDSKSNKIPPLNSSLTPTDTAALGEYLNPLGFLTKLKSELVAIEQRLHLQKTTVQKAASEVGKTEQQLSAVHTMVGKLKAVTRARQENASQEEILSQAISHHALSRQVLGEHTAPARKKAISFLGFDASPGATERITGEQSGGEIALYHSEKPSPHETSFCIEPMQVGVLPSTADNAPSLSVKCHVEGGKGIGVTVSGNANESVKVELAVSDTSLLPLLLREKGAIVKKLREAGHTVSEVNIGQGRGFSFAKESVDTSGYHRRKGGDDELTVS